MGSGVRRIFAKAAAQGLPEPIITEIAAALRLSMYLREPMQTGAVGSEQERAQSRARSNKILLLLTVGHLSANASVARPGLKPKTGAFKRTIKELLDLRLLAQQGDARIKQFNVTYVRL